MTDSDPENEIRDINPPGNGVVNTAPFQAVPELNDPGKGSHAQGPENQNHTHHPGFPGRFHGSDNFVIDISVRELTQEASLVP
jgi:hypothetical protein